MTFSLLVMMYIISGLARKIVGINKNIVFYRCYGRSIRSKHNMAENHLIISGKWNTRIVNITVVITVSDV